MIDFADPDDMVLDPHHERIEELKKECSQSYNPWFRHEDGSFTFIVNDDDSEHANPRHNDGNVAHLVQLHRDYIDIDDHDGGIDEAREKWDWLQYNGHPNRSNRQPDASSSWHNELDRSLVRQGYDREKLVRRYVAMFRPDVLFYEDEWMVQGNSQGDWQSGYAYVTKSDWAEWMGEDYAGDVTPEEAFKQELDIYQQYFRGDVYGGHHVSKGDPIVVIGEQGGYIDGYQADEDSCWGFLGYDDKADICWQFTDSPIVEKG